MISNLRQVILTLLLSASFVGPISGCRSLPDDPVRDANVKSYSRLVPVIQRVLKVDRARISMSTRLASIGVNDSNAITLKSALEKEFGVAFPDKLFLPTSFVNDIVTHIALSVYKVDTSGSKMENSGPVNPELLRQEQQQEKTDSAQKKTDSAPSKSAPQATPSKSPSPAAPGNTK